MIPLILGAVCVLLLLIFGMQRYIRRWLRQQLPERWSAHSRLLGLAALVIACVSVVVFVTPGLVLMHFWLAAMLADLGCTAYRKLTGKNALRRIPLIVPLLTTAFVLIYGSWNIANPIRTCYTYTSPKPLSQNYRIVLITDTHYDTIQDPAVLEAAIPAINAENPDIIILGGDIVEEGTSREAMQEVFAQLGKLNSTYGSYYIFGNHDRQTYSSHPAYSRKELWRTIEDNGITVLSQQYNVIHSELVLAGMEDLSVYRGADRPPLSEFLDPEDAGKLIIVADHQPNRWESHKEGGMDLQLSGHTHAGQIWPIGHFLELAGGLSYGEYHLDGCTAIVSSGFAGWGYTLRTSEHSEYVVIDILADQT